MPGKLVVISRGFLRLRRKMLISVALPLVMILRPFMASVMIGLCKRGSYLY